MNSRRATCLWPDLLLSQVPSPHSQTRFRKHGSQTISPNVFKLSVTKGIEYDDDEEEGGGEGGGGGGG